MPVQCTCRQCGAAFTRIPSHVARGRSTYCSNACRFASMRSQVERICRTCGVVFTKKPCDVQRGSGLYCSQACYSPRRGNPPVELTCQRCGKTFIRHLSAGGSHRYCSWACYRPPRPVQPCTECGRPYRRSWADYFYGHRKQYCSAACRAESKGTLEQRFWARVDRSGGGDACWLWTGYRGTDGYGRITIGRKQYQAHRLGLQFGAGIELSAEQWALHTCPGGDNRACVNPRHLRPGTALENNRDWQARGRSPLTPRSHAESASEP